MEAKLKYLSNSGFLLTTEEGKRILIDPYLTGNAAAPLGPEEIQPVDIVIVTHAAFDHIGDSFQIAKKSNAYIIGDYLVRQLALAAGIPREKIKSCSYGGKVEIAGITLRALMAKHTSHVVNPSGDPITGIPLAFLITTPGGLRIYDAGDTCLFSDMKLIGQLYRPHIGLIPVGAAGPNYGKDLPPSEAAQAAQWVGCELAIPIHYCDDRDAEEFSLAVRILAPWMEVKCMKPGEEINLSIIKQGKRSTFIIKD